MKESEFQRELIKDLRKLFSGCIILKNDPTYLQGIPDLIILYKNHWAMLECKKSEHAHKQPNQEFYVELLNKMSFARFINPTNKEAVLNALQKAFGD